MGLTPEAIAERFAIGRQHEISLWAARNHQMCGSTEDFAAATAINLDTLQPGTGIDLGITVGSLDLGNRVAHEVAHSFPDQIAAAFNNSLTLQSTITQAGALARSRMQSTPGMAVTAAAPAAESTNARLLSLHSSAIRPAEPLPPTAAAAADNINSAKPPVEPKKEKAVAGNTMK